MKDDQIDAGGNRIRFDALAKRWFMWRPDEWKWELMAEQLAPPDVDETLRVADAESAREQAEAIHADMFPAPIASDLTAPHNALIRPADFVPANHQDEGDAADREAGRIDDERWRYS